MLKVQYYTAEIIAILKGFKVFGFKTDHRCVGCGVCTRICPVGNIVLEESKPSWGEECISCFACLHWCSAGAISLGGYDLKTIQYRHPEVKLSDLL